MGLRLAEVGAGGAARPIGRTQACTYSAFPMAKLCKTTPGAENRGGPDR